MYVVSALVVEFFTNSRGILYQHLKVHCARMLLWQHAVPPQERCKHT